MSDQSAARRILPGEFGIEGRDGTWNLHLDGFLRANGPSLDALQVMPVTQAGRDEIEVSLRPGGIIGAVPLCAPHTQKVAGGLVVKPRFGWSGIGPVMSFIGWAAMPDFLRLPLVPGSAREVPAWVIAGPLIRRFAELLRKTSRGFRIVEETRQIPRGRILWHEYAERKMPRGLFHHLPCRFSELGPDLLLRAFLRWGLERIRMSLLPTAHADILAQRLAEEAGALIGSLDDVPPRAPDHRTLDRLLLMTGLPSIALRQGLEGLGWILDERGIGGPAQTDGLSWRLPMHSVFEHWVEAIARRWARTFGGRVTSARIGDSRTPLRWERPGAGSLGALEPDIVVEAGDTVFVLDAKYKSHFEELDETRYRQMEEELRGEHRHDLHQVLAYSTLFDSPRVVAILVYPVYSSTWTAFSQRRIAATRAVIPAGNRRIEVCLVGVPLQVPEGVRADDLYAEWERLRVNDGLQA